MGTHEKGVGARLRRMLAEHEEKAAAIRMTLDLLGVDVKAAKTNGHATVLANAIALDTARTERKKPAKRTVKKPRTKVLAQRERTAQILGMFDATTPRPIAEIAHELKIDTRTTGLAPLLFHGYLKRKGAGFVRTKKPYVVNPFTSAEV